MIEDKELHKLFKAESDEHLARLDDGLLRLEKTPADQALLEEVFRESHSLKGAARMLGLRRIETRAHGLETLLTAARKGETTLTSELIEEMNQALADLRRQVDEALAGGPSATIKSGGDITEFTDPKTDSTPPHFQVSPPEPEPFQSKSSQINISTSQPESVPDESTRSGVLDSQSGSPVLVSPVSQLTAPFCIETVRVETRKLDDLLTQVGELSVIQGRAQHRLTLMEELQDRWLALERSCQKQQPQQHGDEKDNLSVNCAGPGGRFRSPQVVLNARSSDILTQYSTVARVGGLVKQMRDAFFDDSARLDATVNLLENQVHSIRLLPLSTMFVLFPRMVRDLAQEQGKEVELVIEGGDLTVDKRILEEMKDPLMHLLRNAIDHGVELPDEREKLGKQRCSTIWLRARRENTGVLLEVEDNGRGLNPKAIRQVALKRGLHDEATLAAMNSSQVEQLIFMAGFSTSAFVTELSGRGVGLDVVRANVERLKGSIHLESTPGQGMVTQLRLPLSLTTMRILLAEVAGRLYGLPFEFVHTSHRVHKEDIFSLEGRLAILLDGQPVIAVYLADLLELAKGKTGKSEVDTLVCIVLQVGDERLGVLVDELLAEEEVVPKPLGLPLLRVRNISSLAMLANGEICTVLNPADLVSSAHKERGGMSDGLRSGEMEELTEKARPVVLLVEDSALIRAMEKRILEDGGYEVVTAMDGVEGLDALSRRTFAAVVSDIVMPNMDGLTLASRIRRESRYQNMPVILVSSLASESDKKRGLEVGANAYLPKPTFDQRVLLETLQRLVGT